MPQVLTVRRKYFQILRPVVLLIAVPVMHNFCSFKKTPQHSLNYEPMLEHVTRIVSIRMIWLQDVNISLALLPASNP